MDMVGKLAVYLSKSVLNIVEEKSLFCTSQGSGKIYIFLVSSFFRMSYT